MANKEILADSLRIVEAIVVIILLPAMSALAAWMLYTSSTNKERISVIENTVSGGKIYFREDFERDIEPIVEKVNDYELRIRTLEKKD